VALKLEQMGYDDVNVLLGGMDAWTQEFDVTEPKEGGAPAQA
jgi:rhodanese-related sulfurtransferase